VRTQRTLDAGLLLTAFLTPLIVNPWGQHPFAPHVAAFLRFATWSLIALWGLALWLERRSPSRELAGNPLAVPAVALLGILGLATALGVDPRHGLWGSLERGQGFLTLSCYPVLALLVATRCRGEAAVRRLVAALILGSAPVVVIALAQAAGAQPLPFATDARSPIFSTLGRSNFLAAYLALLLPLSLVSLRHLRRPLQRAALLLLLLGAGLLIGASQVRSAWLAVAVSLVVLSGGLALPRLRARLDRPADRPIAWAAGLGALALVVSAGLWLAQVGGSGAARLATWQATARLVLRRPFLGYGPDSLELVFPRVFPPELVYYQGRGFITDRAHNLLLDWSITTGVLGLAAFLGSVGVVLWVGVRALLAAGAEESPRSTLLAAFLATLAGWLTNALISFDVTATATVGWLVMGATVALARTSPAPPQASEATDRPRRARTLAAAMVVAVVVSAGMVNLRPVEADVAARRAVLASATDRPREALAKAHEAVQIFPWSARYRALAAEVALEGGPSEGTRRARAVDAAEAILADATRRHPLRVELWTSLGRVYAERVAVAGGDDLSRAHAAFSRAAGLAPNHGVVLREWARVDLATGAWEPAEAKLRRAIELDATDLAAWLLLGGLYEERDQPFPAMNTYRQATRMAPGSMAARLGLARNLQVLGDVEAARRAVEQALELDPKSEDARRLASALEQSDEVEPEEDEQ